MDQPFEHISSNPLYWPDSVPRTERPKRSNFKQQKTTGYGFTNKTVATAIDELKTEIRLLGGKNLIISTNLTTKKNGMPYSNAAEPEDSGVAVYFTLDESPRCYPNDKWDRVADNIYGIAKIIGAQRGIERWGTQANMEAAFQGFKMIPDKTSGESWWDYLQINPKNATESEIAKAYRSKVKEVHPDRPDGSSADFQKAKQMKQQALNAVKS